MILVLQREWVGRTSTIGLLHTMAGDHMYSLERRPDAQEHPCIPAGTYGLTLEPTHNPRLWSPYPDRCLPHVWDVPGRTGIEIHAGDTAVDTEGCVVVAYILNEDRDSLSNSRPAVRRLVDALRAAEGHHGLVVMDPPAEQPYGAAASPRGAVPAAREAPG